MTKFDKYFTDERRFQIITRIERNSRLFIPVETLTIGRDPKDNMFLELAVSANAACIVSGDYDLLVLHPFRDIPIITPAEFLKSDF